MPAIEPSMENRIEARAGVILTEQKNSLYCHTDRMFAILLLVEWLAGIVVSLWISPRTWAGRYSDVNLHVYVSVFLVGFIILPPVLMAVKRPGETLTRHMIASAQMLFSAVLIHLTGGRLESHFHIFGSLAFLSFYRDWKVLIPATIIVALDHLVRGFFFPLSVYGVSFVEPWRWLEHSGWVLFEDVILIRMCQRNVREMILTSRRQAEVEEVNANVEALVVQRTNQLQQAQDWERMQYKIVRQFSDASSCLEAMNGAIQEMASFFSIEQNIFLGAFYAPDQKSQKLIRSTYFQTCESALDALLQESHSKVSDNGKNLVLDAWAENRAFVVSDLGSNQSDASLKLARENGITSCAVFPVGDHQNSIGVIELFSDAEMNCETSALEGLGRLIGQFVMKKEAEVTRERLAYVVEHSNDAIFTLSVDNLITGWNLGAEKVFAYRSEEILGKPMQVLLAADNVSDVQEFLE
ncbi:MAG: PAS domain S-box protein, partial [Candidatus Obscuribacterales bacterium]|nr:PAS domain S-box protein [Candidatus Obscuribacterales bacterium]